jgi:hypothetical protein
LKSLTARKSWRSTRSFLKKDVKASTLVSKYQHQRGTRADLLDCSVERRTHSAASRTSRSTRGGLLESRRSLNSTVKPDVIEHFSIYAH